MHMNDMQQTGAQNLYDAGNLGFGYGNQFMNTALVTVRTPTFIQAGQDNISDAMDYATANSQPLIDAAMRDKNS